MKKSIPTLLIILLGISLSSYQWHGYGPSGINAFKIKFFMNHWNCALLTENGFYLENPSSGTSWDFYDFKAKDAESYNEDTILVIYSEGTYSDGIYFLDINTHETSVIEYLYKPNFIHNTGDHFYVGYDEGLYRSEDAINWTQMNYFSGRKCTHMTGWYGDTYALAIDSLESNVFISEDEGASWANIILSFKISDLETGNNIYGLRIDGMDCALYSYGNGTWYHEISLFKNSTALGVDNTGNPFVGWWDGSMPYKGIALFRSPNFGLEFYNLGLPNHNINDISNGSLAVGGKVVYCCTDSGAYYCDYNVGVEKLDDAKDIIAFPNPFAAFTNIKYYLQDPGSVTLKLYNQNGQIIHTENRYHNSPGSYTYNWNPANHPTGIYYCKLIAKNLVSSVKLVYYK